MIENQQTTKPGGRHWRTAELARVYVFFTLVVMNEYVVIHDDTVT